MKNPHPWAPMLIFMLSVGGCALIAVSPYDAAGGFILGVAFLIAFLDTARREQ